MLCLYDREISLAQFGCDAQTTCKIENPTWQRILIKSWIVIPLAEGEHHITQLYPPNAISPLPPPEACARHCFSESDNI